MLPEGWRTVPIGSVFRSSQYGLNLAVDAKGTTPIIGMKDMVRGRVVNSGWGSVALSEADRGRYLLRRGDILLNRTNSPDLVGKVACWDRDEEAVFPSYIVRFVCDENQVDPAFVSLCLNTDDGQGRLRQISTRGVSQANINPSTFQSAFKITLPPLPEQQRIAAVLDAWDIAIATAEQLVEARVALSSAFIARVCFAVNDMVEIGDVTEQTGDVAGTDFVNFPVLSCTKHDGLVLSDEYFDRQVYGANRTNYKKVEPSCFAYATNHVEEGSIGLNLTGATGIVSPMYTTFRATNIHAPYLIAVLKTERLRREFERMTPASVNRRGGLRWPDFATIVVPMPSLPEQEQIAERVETAQRSVSAMIEYLAALRGQKRALTHLLLTGRLRVPKGVDRLLPPAIPAMDTAA